MPASTLPGQACPLERARRDPRVRSAEPARQGRRNKLSLFQMSSIVQHGATVSPLMEHDIDEVLAREVAAATLTDVRTVRRVLRGERVRGLVGARIRAELERRGKPPLSAPTKST